ncbi:MAG: hypothetical protein HFE81_06710 [Bacilli bacterium]|nr:hypothetical protein [Bacilli bacterium]
MENKNDLINEYIDDLATKLNKEYPHILDENQINKAKNMFKDSSKDLDSMQSEIDALAEQTIAEYISLKEKQRVFKEMMKASSEHLGKVINKDKLEQKSETIETPENKASDNQEAFNQRSQREGEIANQIRTKNQMLASQKENQSEKGKTLVKSNSKSSNNQGYTNIAILSLALSVAASMLSIIVYLIINH